MNTIKEFEDWLNDRKVSKTTASLYLSDVKKAVSWIKKSYGSIENITPEMIDSYERFLTTTKLSEKSIKRAYSSLRSFSKFLNISNNNIKGSNIGERNYWRDNFTVYLMIFIAIVTVSTLFVSFFEKSQIQYSQLPISGEFGISNSGKISGQTSVDAEQPNQFISPRIDGGRGVIKTGGTEVKIFSQQSSPFSAITVSPTEEYNQMYIKNQESGSFTVSLTSPAKSDVLFSWTVVNNFYVLDTPRQ